jgi:predicted nucleic acid-binding protein
VAKKSARDLAVYQRRYDRGNSQGAWFDNRILPVTHAIADRWGLLDGQCQLQGTPLNTADGLIGATALEHGLRIVTRNEKDFAAIGGSVVNPWAI